MASKSTNCALLLASAMLQSMSVRLLNDDELLNVSPQPDTCIGTSVETLGMRSCNSITTTPDGAPLPEDDEERNAVCLTYYAPGQFHMVNNNYVQCSGGDWWGCGYNHAVECAHPEGKDKWGVDANSTAIEEETPRDIPEIPTTFVDGYPLYVVSEEQAEELRSLRLAAQQPGPEGEQAYHAFLEKLRPVQQTAAIVPTSYMKYRHEQKVEKEKQAEIREYIRQAKASGNWHPIEPRKPSVIKVLRCCCNPGTFSLAIRTQDQCKWMEVGHKTRCSVPWHQYCTSVADYEEAAREYRARIGPISAAAWTKMEPPNDTKQGKYLTNFNKWSQKTSKGANPLHG